MRVTRLASRDRAANAALHRQQDHEPTVRDVRQALGSSACARSTARGVTLFAVTMSAYLIGFASVMVCPSYVVKLVLALVTGTLLAPLFVVGHDACHGSLTPRRWLNRLLGRLCFMPCCHPYAAWEYAHNGLHHGYTNVRGFDPVFPPIDPSRYRQLPALRRVAERVMRSAGGVLFLYACKVWVPHVLAPRKRTTLPPRVGRRFQWDRAAVVAFVALQSSLLWLHASHAGESFAALVLLAMVLPMIVFLYLLAWAVHIHHTHPSVPWFPDCSSWSFFRGQVRCVVHMELPHCVEVFLLNIMDHTAHHADPGIPLYELHSAQEKIERIYADDIVHERFSFRGWLRIFRICRLYDDSTHRWLDWDGTPLTPPLLPPCSRVGEVPA